MVMPCGDSIILFEEKSMFRINPDFIIEQLSDGNAICYNEKTEITVVMNKTSLNILKFLEGSNEEEAKKQFIKHYRSPAKKEEEAEKDFILRLEDDFKKTLKLLLNSKLLTEQRTLK